MSLQRVSKCSRARAQHSPYRGCAARLCTRLSSILPRSWSGPEPGPDISPEPIEGPKIRVLHSSGSNAGTCFIPACLKLSQSECCVSTCSWVSAGHWGAVAF
ncbi:hypothetical protein XENOCAPTIV_018517 [Xenoophorus captivus]|uniref:Uncharacterized protein n=1 Tax=Xenoophorus captivus TaxID=1517983 RepID=A0ABV0RBB9_9TELE